MTDTHEPRPATYFPELVRTLVEDYRAEPRTSHLDSPFLPNRDEAVRILDLLRRLVFPGFFDAHRLTSDMIEPHVLGLLETVRRRLYEQVRQALRYERNLAEEGGGAACTDCDRRAREICDRFLSKLPEVRRILATDVQAAFEGDPAATGTDETVFCYPGVYAIFTHRLAHELWLLGVPLLPRIMTEWAHTQTGIDIHPGARIAESFFVDHGTGVVVGETTVIGKRVKVYQGVTLGALSTKGGQAWRGRKRHPTIEDDVTIYGGAIILGGDTIIGRGATIGGSVFITSSIPPGHTVSMSLPNLEVRPPRKQSSLHDEPGPVTTPTSPETRNG